MCWLDLWSRLLSRPELVWECYKNMSMNLAGATTEGSFTSMLVELTAML